MKKVVAAVRFWVLLLTLFCVAGDAWAASVPDTGQTTYYDAEGNVIPCRSQDEAFYGQNTNYTINLSSYTKLDSSGNALSASATSWVMVRDNVTGLIWEVKTNKDGAKDYYNPHDADNTYTWYDSNSETNEGDAGTPGNGTDTEDFIAALNVENFGGHNDWRLPRIKDSASIVDYKVYNPSINSTYFKNIMTSSYYYVRAYATNNADTTYGENVTFRTNTSSGVTFCVSDATQLQSALTTAASNGEDDVVQIVQGTYVGNFVYDSTEANSITIEGGYTAGCSSREVDPSNTVLDGDAAGRVLELSVPEQAAASFLVDGVTLTDGYEYGGCGVLAYSPSGTVTLTNNTITGNSGDSSGSGGGVAAYGTVTLTNNTITENSAYHSGGGVFAWSSYGTVTLTNNTITGNSTNNSGGGVLAWSSDGTVTLTNNTIKGNSANNQGGGVDAYSDYGTVALLNNTITGNFASNDAGGVETRAYGSVTLTNNTITGNSTNGDGGGLRIWRPTQIASIYNNIIWDNTAESAGNDLYINDDVNDINLFNNDFDQSAAGTFIGIPFVIDSSNLDNIDPLFLDASGGDFHLNAFSPCINVGDNAAPGLPEYDKDGNPRIINDIVDLGAYESTNQAITHTITATAEIGGTISPSGRVTVNDGDSQSFTITPNSGYEISDVKVDGKSQGVISSYTFSDVTSDHTISASFTQQVSTLCLGEFKSMASMGVPRTGISAALAQGKVYVFGGRLISDTTALKTVEMYDSTSNTWTQKAEMPTARTLPVANSVNDKIYVIGGAVGGSSWGSYKLNEMYDPGNDSWVTKAQMPTARHAAISMVYDGNIYVIGGEAGTYNPTGVVEIYNPETDSWSTGASMPTARGQSAIAECNGEWYIISGYGYGYGGFTDAVEKYNPATNTWNSLTSTPYGLRSAKTVVSGGKIYCIGGRGYDTDWFWPGMLVYDIASDTWDTCENDSFIKRESFAAAILNNEFFAFGGQSFENTIAATQKISLSVCPDCSGANPVVQNVTFKAGTDCTCTGDQSLTIGPGVVVESGAKATFKSNRINVKSGVDAKAGSVVKMGQ